ncbi:hypothetical protein PIB30_041206 [Stylosanthes scabra]|uniref:BED-type domain-containing protein n=1 Tax=Stylosanthes scabra TaxID=79078 RepID=A0ABU6ZDK0_9FABA|nr:hypothetical protein [Stylosanthes scabra]
MPGCHHPPSSSAPSNAEAASLSPSQTIPATASVVVPPSNGNIVAQPPPSIAQAPPSVIPACSSVAQAPPSVAVPSHPSQRRPTSVENGTSGHFRFDISSSGNNGDIALPNDSASVRSPEPEALPAAPAPRPPVPQRNTKKVAVRGRAKRRAIEEPSEDDTPETATNAAEPSDGNRKPSRPRSWTWEHFTKDPNCNPEYPRAKCNWCGASYACDTHKNGTTNMKNHLMSQCKRIPKEVLDPT